MQLDPESQATLDRRKLHGEQAINVHPDYPLGIDAETAAQDVVSDILTHLFGPSGYHIPGRVVSDEYALNEARAFIERTFTAWEHDNEDYAVPDRPAPTVVGDLTKVDPQPFIDGWHNRDSD